MNVVSLRAVQSESAPVHLLGRLSGFLPDGQISVEDEAGVPWLCRRAASCLLKPEMGDTVLLSGPDGRRIYLIAVVEQSDTSASCIDAPGDLCLRSPGKLRMQAGEWVLEAEKGDCQIAEMRYTGQAIDATVGRLRLVGRVFESVADRMVQMARSALRLIDETDQSRVGHLDVQATETVRIHGKHALVTGKELVKLDAAQVHLG
jgi:hypothetical protein